MRVDIDKNKCTGHGLCYTLAPALFHDDDMGYGAITGTGEVTAVTAGEAQSAETVCPESAVVFDRSGTPA